MNIQEQFIAYQYAIWTCECGSDSGSQYSPCRLYVTAIFVDRVATHDVLVALKRGV
jgi:hypothetical protein